MVIVDEPENANNNQRHVLPNGKVHEGILSFWKDNDTWHYEGHTDKPTPDVCFAIKYPLQNLESLQWPDLSEIQKQLDKENPETYKNSEGD